MRIQVNNSEVMQSQFTGFIANCLKQSPNQHCNIASRCWNVVVNGTAVLTVTSESGKTKNALINRPFCGNKYLHLVFQWLRRSFVNYNSHERLLEQLEELLQLKICHLLHHLYCYLQLR